MSNPTETRYYLTGKIFIEGKIKALTGLHIGGSKSALDIGGIDLGVIKTAKNAVPFIPGSSLKGKLRTMLAREGGYRNVKEDNDAIKRIFGQSADEKHSSMEVPTKLLVRDAFLREDDFEKEFEDAELDFEYSEEKWENTINRKTGTAEHPRQIERVPAGAMFDFQLVYNIYVTEDQSPKETLEDLQLIRQSMNMLKDDYLGGHGSRGYGRIEFKDVKATVRSMEDYKQADVGETLLADDFLGSDIARDIIPVKISAIAES